MNDYSGFCCICIESPLYLVNISQSDDQGISYSNKLNVCESSQDWEDGMLAICQSCIDKLNLAFEFIESCKKSQVLRTEKLLQLQDAEDKNADMPELLECDICERTFKKKRFLKLHITRIHSQKKKNKVKGKENKDKLDSNVLDGVVEKKTLGLQNDSIIQSDDEQVYLIENDDAIISSEEECIKKPARKKRGPKRRDPLNCEYCGKLFNRRQHWSAHIRANHTFEKPYKCNLCDASFINSHSLLVHKRNHNNEKPYICSKCGKGFVCSGDLYHHSKIHLNKREYQCNICEKRFNTTSILRTHKIVKHTDPKDWKYVCTICDRPFPIHSGLAIHMKRHAGIKDVACHICNKKFFNRSEVSKHFLSHSNERHFKCLYCGEKEYKNHEGLRKHMKVVHDMGTWKPPKLEKKFLCTLCPKVFTFNNKLQRHLLTHSGEKPFKSVSDEIEIHKTSYELVAKVIKTVSQSRKTKWNTTTKKQQRSNWGSFATKKRRHGSRRNYM